MGSAKDVVLKSLPLSMRLPVWYLIKKMTGTIDAEIGYLKKKIVPDRGMVDVGANIGIYTYALRKTCSFIHAFEPQPDCLKVLRTTESDLIHVHPVALSDTAGELDLHIPVKQGSRLDGLASFRPLPGEVVVEKVRVDTLDTFAFTDVGFLKIDVEGYEMNVLRGAAATIRRERPLILIEIEQRHLEMPITAVFDAVHTFGYTGGFIAEGTWHPIARFDYMLHQQPFENAIRAEKYHKINGAYVNNFIFEPVNDPQK